jgi:hypothetical protein
VGSSVVSAGWMTISPVRLNCFQVLTARDERYVLARAGQLRSEVTARATCAVDRYAHFASSILNSRFTF